MEIKISPSLLASDFANLENEIKKCEAAGVEMIHVDVMDGHFVPNITIGAPVVKAIRRVTKLPLDVHLMISHPLDYIEDFARAGADIITFHYESKSPVQETIDKIKSCYCKPSISIKPATAAEKVLPYMDSLSMVLVMTVEPGFGGQKFMADMLPKIRRLRAAFQGIDIEVDGGIDSDTVSQAAAAGANVFVAGSAVFAGGGVANAVKELKEKAKAGMF
ncbi:MAG: ribulose-phosphate 3-epimerase [Clostridiales bacterium]|nr:ribulose-phosphate 3-epimerase [Clostridiales bacterium]